MATKFGTKSAITRLICEISRRSLRIKGGFRVRAIEWRQPNSTTSASVCHVRTLSVCFSGSLEDLSLLAFLPVTSCSVRAVTVVIFGHFNRSFYLLTYLLTTTNTRCHGNKICDKIGYKSACIRDISEIFAYNRGFSWSCYWMTLPDKFYHDQPPLSWQRNFGQKRL